MTMPITDGPRKAVLYARISRKDKQDADQMLRALEGFAGTRGWVVHSQHKDEVSGDPARRKTEPDGLRNALDDVARLQGCGVLVISAADRLVRSPMELLQLVARIQALPGFVVSMEDGGDLDTTSDYGELLLFIRGWFSRMELKFIRKRTKYALDDRRDQIRESGGFTGAKSGVYRTALGRPRIPDEQIEGIRRCWVAGKWPGVTANELGIKKSTVRTYFRRFGEEQGGVKNATGREGASNGEKAKV
jgi:DNA invertase Pin-like site-specific DNA recombinase